MTEWRPTETIIVKLIKENDLYHVKINDFTAGSYNDIKRANEYYEIITDMVNTKINKLMGKL